VQKGRADKDTIVAANVVRSAPCGSTWFVAKRLLGLEPDQSDIRERISEAHHAYPCTGSMERDTELGDTILHKGGYIIRGAVEDSFKKARRLDKYP
jgi:hypothetical protein